MTNGVFCLNHLRRFDHTLRATLTVVRRSPIIAQELQPPDAMPIVISACFTCSWCEIIAVNRGIQDRETGPSLDGDCPLRVGKRRRAEKFRWRAQNSERVELLD